MGSLSFTATVSLDGFAADADGDFDWTAPDSDVFRFHVERMDQVTAEVLGRRTYALMQYWERDPGDGAWSGDEWEFARRWRRIEHIVASSTLTQSDLTSERDRLVQSLDLAELARIVESSEREVEIFGPTTAGPALQAGMVEDLRLFVVPRMVGGGLRALPQGAALDFALLEQRLFRNGTVYLHYRAQRPTRP